MWIKVVLVLINDDNEVNADLDVKIEKNLSLTEFDALL